MQTARAFQTIESTQYCTMAWPLSRLVLRDLEVTDHYIKPAEHQSKDSLSLGPAREVGIVARSSEMIHVLGYRYLDFS